MTHWRTCARPKQHIPPNLQARQVHVASAIEMLKHSLERDKYRRQWAKGHANKSFEHTGGEGTFLAEDGSPLRAVVFDYSVCLVWVIWCLSRSCV